MKRAICAVTSLLLVAACGQERSSSFETEDGETVEYSVDTDGGESTVKYDTEDGSGTIRSGTDVAVELPAGFTLYPGAKVVTNTSFSRDDGQGASVIFNSDDQPDEVLAFYRKQAEAAGVTIEMEMKTGQGTMLGGKGEGDLVFTLNATAQDGGTAGQMMVGKGIE